MSQNFTKMQMARKAMAFLFNKNEDKNEDKLNRTASVTYGPRPILTALSTQTLELSRCRVERRLTRSRDEMSDQR